MGYNRKPQVYALEINGKPADGIIEPVSSGGGAWGDQFNDSSQAGGKCDGGSGRAW